MLDAPAAPAQTDKEAAELADSIQSRTPTAVLETYIPPPSIIAGVPVVPMTAGHLLLLEAVNNPIVTRKGVPNQFDCLQCLHIFSRPALEARTKHREGTLETSVHQLADTIPAAEMLQLLDGLKAYINGSMTTALAMSVPGSTAEKKTGDSAGS